MRTALVSLMRTMTVMALNGGLEFAKDCLLTCQEQACTRITRLFGCSFGCHLAKNGHIHRKMAVDCPLVITSIVETLFKTRPDQERGIIVRFKFCRNGDVLRNNCLFKFCQNGDVWL